MIAPAGTIGVKLCKDCKHAIPVVSWKGIFWRKSVESFKFARCSVVSPVKWAEGLKFVTGELSEEELTYCTSERFYGKECGPEGKLFKPKI